MSSSVLFTDHYQLTMAYAYLKAGMAEKSATFEMFFRRCPFHGEYAVVSGFDFLKEIVENFKFEKDDIEFIRSVPSFQNIEPNFFDRLKNLDLSQVTIQGMREGRLAFPRVPILQVTGPIFETQILESALLNAINFSTLVTTNARRIKMVGGTRGLFEFGLRRAQGPNGAMTASRASYLGGFDGTSNLSAAKKFGIPTFGTMAHSFVQSFKDIDPKDLIWNGESVTDLLQKFSEEDGLQTNRGELGAFLSFAKSFPQNCVLLVDTYDSISSGIPNAVRVFKLLQKFGHQRMGIRLDSGDLVYLSNQAREIFERHGLQNVQIYASNELDEGVIESLQKQGAKIDHYGIGTRLVTSSEDPALGGVYKLVEFDGRPRLKISQQTEKLVLPGAKKVYRLYNSEDLMLLDLLATRDESVPLTNKPIQALHPSDSLKKAIVIAKRVEPLLEPIFEKGIWKLPMDLKETRLQSLAEMKHLRADIARRENPTPYKVSLTPALKALLEDLYHRERPETAIY